MPTITPSLWFDGNLEEAAEFYTSVFPNSSIGTFARYTEAGPGTPGEVVSGTFVLDGQEFVGINGGPEFPFSEAVSFVVDCADQDEVDYYWNRLVDGGEESQCGWLKDRFGLSWQIIPRRLHELLGDADPVRAEYDHGNVHPYPISQGRFRESRSLTNRERHWSFARCCVNSGSLGFAQTERGADALRVEPLRYRHEHQRLCHLRTAASRRHHQAAGASDRHRASTRHGSV